MSLTIYLLRHGETEYSRTGGFCGDVDCELTEQGHEMAGCFAGAYKNIPWQAIYCSPMKRARDTAAPLAALTNLPVLLRDGLKEIRYGAWEGRTAEQVKTQYPQDYANWREEPAWNAPTGGETAVHIANRAMPVIYEIQSEHKDGNVLLVSHKATIRIILCSLLGIELGRYRDRIDAPAASVSIVRFTQHGPLLEVLGDRSHMTSELRELVGT